ncbi:diacylglycerol kinase [Streptomyces meridianus]|uniref:Diacylglycerol kinase n=1 Tax=Streptomyces meridianus TaxID=2938945 RepID=A0ABT0X5D2_9ACTN|nr:diacylglycerol kinase [Streptomyces meridianus]MCM2577748.1 diacylglycerol kinase [Streptomyces meridianus]
MSAQRHGHPPADPVRESPLLVVIDPNARRTDGESVRIAKDVLCAGASAKICLPENARDLARAVGRRGRRRPVVVGDDSAFLRVVNLLYRERALADAVLSMVPVGADAASVSVARGLGVPTDTVDASRAVLDGTEQRIDLLVDESDGVVLGDLRIPASSRGADSQGHGPLGVWDCYRSLMRSLTVGKPSGRADAPPQILGDEAHPGHRLRVEADGVVLADLDRPVQQVRVSADGGFAEVVVRESGEGASGVRTLARRVTVSGADFRYRADALVGGPVRTRTWTVQPGACRLTLPRG